MSSSKTVQFYEPIHVMANTLRVVGSCGNAKCKLLRGNAKPLWGNAKLLRGNAKVL